MLKMLLYDDWDRKYTTMELKAMLELSVFSMIILLLMSLSVTATNVSDAMAYWTMNNTYTDSSGNGYDLSISGSMPYETGIINSSAWRDGADSNYLYNSDSAFKVVTDQSFSVGCWVNATIVDSGDRNLLGNYCPACGDGDNGWTFTYKDGGMYAYWGDGGCNYYIADNVPDGSWTMVTMTVDGSNDNVSIYYNTTLKGQTTCQIASQSSDPFKIGQFNTAVITQSIDECFFWNRTLTTEEIKLIHGNVTAGNTYPFPEALPPPPEYNTYLELFNETATNITTLDESTEWWVRANYSVDGEPLNNDTCWYNTTQMTGVNFELGANKTISEGDVAQLTFSYWKTTGHQEDRIKFQICRDGNKHPVNILINGSLHHQINQNDIPSCTNGYHQELNVTDEYLTDKTINLSVQCPACTGTNTMRIISDNKGRILTYDRVFSIAPLDDFGVNATSGWYEDTGHYHRWENSGVYDMQVQCGVTRNDTEVRSYIVGDILPISEILTITDSAGTYSFVNNTGVESGDISILGDCRGDVIDFTQINVTFTNGTLIQSADAEYIEVLSAQLTEDAIYNVSMHCTDDDGNSTITYKHFVMNDTTSPIILWQFPNSLNTSTATQFTTKTVIFYTSDLNLFSVGIICKNSIGVEILNFYEENISNTAYQIINETANLTLTGVYNCNATVQDSHTAKDISKFDIETQKLVEDNSMLFTLETSLLNISLSGITADDFIIQQEKDRYSFYPLLKEFPSSLTYFIECSDQLYHFKDKSYDGKTQFGEYYNCGDFWIDFYTDAQPDFKKYKFTPVDDHKARIDIKNIPFSDNLSSLKTNSVGVKNTIHQNQLFNVSEASTEITSENQPLTDSVISFVLFCIWAFCLVMGFAFSTPIFIVIGGLLGIAFGFVLLSLTTGISLTLVSFLLIIFNGVLTIVGFMSGKD